MTSTLALPSARELGISTAHRRAILRESNLMVYRAMMLDYMRDAREVEARTIVEGVCVLELVGGESAAEDLRASYVRGAQRAHGLACAYMRRRAAGDSPRDIIADRYTR